VSAAPQDPPRTLSDRYALERLLGRGGMAAVYLARDLKQDRQVAVKVLDADLAQSVSSDRFLREISIAGKLAHPNILPLHDSGRDGDTLYYVMPFVEGETLRARLDRERQLPLEEAMRIACEVASALDYAHRQQILHRDIKPENILLEDGHAIVADFGIARALGSSADQRMTATGMALGTPAYMSPEQATGETTIDARSDVYALACVMYEMLAGEPPFTGPTAQAVIAKRMGGPPPRIRTVRPSIPESLERALLRAMDPVPADRFATAKSFADAMSTCSTIGETQGRRRQPLMLAAAAAVLLALLGAGWMYRDMFTGGERTALLAVLPLVNQSADPEHAYLAEGLTDALIGDLSEARGVRVVSRMSVMRYGSGMGTMQMAGAGSMEAGAMQPAGGEMAMSGSMAGGMTFMADAPAAGEPAMGGSAPAAGMMKPRAISDIARELRADILLQGTLRRAGDSVTVDAALVSAPALEEVWRGSYTRHVRELFALQRELVTAIVGAVARQNVSGGGAAVRDATRVYTPEAHDSYLKGSYFLAHLRLPEAVAALERAVEFDPSHAPAHSSLARAYYFMAFFGDVPPNIAVAGMRRAANAALEQDSLLAEAHGQLALVKMLQEWDWAGAERHFNRALELSPGHAQIRHDYAHFLLGQGRHQESAEHTRQALAMDPVNPMLIACMGWHSLFDGRYGDAQRFALEANSMMPDHWAYVVLGWAMLGQGKADSALVAFREANRLNESAFTLAALGHGLAATGKDAEARRTLGLLLDRAEREYVSPYDIATVYAGLGDADDTFKWLRRATEERSTFIVHVGWDSRFNRVREDARFADLTRRELRLPTHQFAAVTAGDRRGM
jgi:TolB-like protein